MDRTDSSDQFRKKKRHKCIGYDLNVMRQSACSVINPIINPITVDNGSCVRLYDGPGLKLFILIGWDRSYFVCCLVHRGSTDDLFLLQISRCVVWQTRDLHLSHNTLYLLSPRLCFFIILKRDLFVYRDDSFTS